MQFFPKVILWSHISPVVKGHGQSWKAILLYVSLGFKLQKNDTFSHYVNQYDDAMKTLKEHISDEQFKMLEKNSV